MARDMCAVTVPGAMPHRVTVPSSLTGRQHLQASEPWPMSVAMRKYPQVDRSKSPVVAS